MLCRCGRTHNTAKKQEDHGNHWASGARSRCVEATPSLPSSLSPLSSLLPSLLPSPSLLHQPMGWHLEQRLALARPTLSSSYSWPSCSTRLRPPLGSPHSLFMMYDEGSHLTDTHSLFPSLPPSFLSLSLSPSLFLPLSLSLSLISGIRSLHG